MINKKPLFLRVFPDPALSACCVPYENFGEEGHIFAAELIVAMREFRGIGLAANQVGILRRVFAMSGEALNSDHDHVFFNPVIQDSKDPCFLEEGCLSLPGVRYVIEGRANQVTLGYQNENGEACTMTLDGLAALCVQHEIDHLDGITMLDKMSPLKANRAKTKLAKSRKPSR